MYALHSRALICSCCAGQNCGLLPQQPPEVISVFFAENWVSRAAAQLFFRLCFSPEAISFLGTFLSLFGVLGASKRSLCGVFLGRVFTHTWNMYRKIWRERGGGCNTPFAAGGLFNALIHSQQRGESFVKRLACFCTTVTRHIPGI